MNIFKKPHSVKKLACEKLHLLNNFECAQKMKIAIKYISSIWERNNSEAFKKERINNEKGSMMNK